MPHISCVCVLSVQVDDGRDPAKQSSGSPIRVDHLYLPEGRIMHCTQAELDARLLYQLVDIFGSLARACGLRN